VEDNTRTALPSVAFDKYILRFAYTGGSEGYTHGDVEWIGGLSVDLEPGDWTVYVDAYTGTVVLGTGSTDVTVSAEIVTPVTIRVGPNPGAGVQGTLKYKVSYPTTGHSYSTETLTVRDTAGATVGSPAAITNGVEGSVSLTPGMYFVGVMINDTVQQTGAARTTAVHIYGGKETSLVIAIGEEEFTAIVPVTVTAALTVPSGITVESRQLTRYTDALGTAPLDTVVIVGSGAVTLWAPSSSAAVYIRQDVVIGGVTLNGHIETVTMTGTGKAVSLADTLYKITVSNDTAHGTVQSNVPAAFPGNSITITAVEDQDAFFVDTTLDAWTGSSSITLSGSGANGSFTMPGEDVELYAEFHQFVRYGKAGETGSGESWEDASDDVQRMMDELAVLSANYASDYTGPYVVKLGAGTYKPKYKPMVPSDPAELVDYEYNTPGDTRDKAFILRPNVQVWGGYTAGGEDIGEAERKGRFGTYGEAVSAYKAILSGDLDNDNAISGNDAYHVVLAVSTSAVPITDTTVLDGLTISGGNASGSGSLTVGTYSIEQQNAGGVYNREASPALNRVTISGNTTYIDGGGMYNRDYSSPKLANVTISDNHITGGGGGGGMFNYYESSPTLEYVTISNNTAGTGGGMYNIHSSSPSLTDVTISNNTATPGSGGGMFNSFTSSPTLINVIISNNTANTATTGKGGGIFNDNGSSPALTNVTISGNTAAGDGGGIYNDNSSPELDGVTIGGSDPADKNTAANGGGMYNSGSSPVLTNVTISGNAANSNGGGIYNNSSSPLLVNVKIYGNEVMDGGGGMINNGSSSSPLLVNVLIFGNKANEGGGIENVQASMTLINVTIAGNQVYYAGGGIYNSGGSSVIKNSIIWGNARESFNSGFAPTVTDSIVEGVDGDPLFSNPEPAGSAPTTEGDYRLSVNTSPAVDMGNDSDYPTDTTHSVFSGFTLSADAVTAINTALGYDVDGPGYPRQNGQIDMGAHEY
jgi:hypothetical protein